MIIALVTTGLLHSMPLLYSSSTEEELSKKIKQFSKATPENARLQKLFNYTRPYLLAAIPEIKKLIENGGDPNMENDLFVSYLGIALVEEHFDLTKFLLEHGADPNRSSGLPLLFYCKNLETLKLMVKHKADIFVQVPDRNNTMLHECMKTIDKDGKMTEFLIERGVPINVRNRFGANPLLYLACISDHHPIETVRNKVSLLLEARAEKHERIMEGITEWYPRERLFEGMTASEIFRKHAEEREEFNEIADLIDNYGLAMN